MSLEETLKINKFKTRKLIEKKKEEQLKKEKKERFIVTIVSLLIIVMVIYFIATCNKMLDKSVNNCMNLGYTQDYCYKKLA